MLNVNQITSTLAKLPDPELQRYAAMHKNDPYIVSLAVAESNRRKAMRDGAIAQGSHGEPAKVVDQDIAGMASALPETQGIGRLPAGEMNFAGGGIIAFAGEGPSLVVDRDTQRSRDQDAFQIIMAEYQRAQGQLQAAQASGNADAIGRAQADVAALQRELARFNKRGIGDAVTAALPIGSATAGTLPAKGAPAQPAAAAAAPSAVSQIPGQDGKPVPEPAPYVEPKKSLMDYITSPFQTAYALAHNTAAMPIAGVEALAKSIYTGKDVNPDLRKYAYVPGNPVSQEQLGTISKVMDDLKLPPYIPMLTPVQGARPLPASVQQTASAADNLRLPMTPRVAGMPTEPAVVRVNPERVAAQTARQVANMADDTARAAQAKAALGQNAANIAGARAINAELPGQATRLGIAGLAGNAAQQTAGMSPAAPAAPATVDDGSYDRLEANRLKPRPIDTEAKKAIADAAKDATPEKQRRGLDGEDFLMMGLQMMANKSPRFMQAFGESGIATLKNRQDRIKEEREQLSDEAKNKYYSSMGKYYDANAASLSSGTKMLPQALAAANAAYDDWFKSLNPVEASQLTAEQKAMKREQFVAQAMAEFKMPGTGLPASLPQGVTVRQVQ